MHRRRRRGPAAFASAALLACSTVTSARPTVDPETDFELARGRSALIAGSFVTVSLDSVTEDSRCPTDVQCVWEGNATLRLTMDSAGTARIVELTSAHPWQPVAAYGFTLELRGLRPVPVRQAPPTQNDYVATLRVTASP